MTARANFPVPLQLTKFAYQGTTANAIVTNTRGWQNCLDTDVISGTPVQVCALIGDRIQGASGERTLEILTRINPQWRRPPRWRRYQGYYRGGNFNDAHNTISVCWHNDGRLLVDWDTHDTPLLSWTGRSAGAALVTGKDALPIASGASTQEATVTYQSFVKYENGDRLRVYRTGVSGNGNTVVEFYDAGTGQWSLRQSNLIDGESARSAYTGAPCRVKKIGGIEWTFIWWNWREVDSNYTTNHDLYCMASPDKGATWKRMDGTTQTIPATQGNGPLAYTLATNSGLWNANDHCIDDTGRPYGFWYYGAAPSQTWCHYWQGTFQGSGAWVRSQVGAETGSNSLVGVTSPSGSLWTGPGGALQRSGTVHYLKWATTIGTGLYRFKADVSALQSSPSTSWGSGNRVHTGNWSLMQHWINFDRQLFKTYGLVDVFYQNGSLADVVRIDLEASL